MKHFKRHLQPIKQHFFLFGPRGTGKTTWLRECFPDAVIVDLLLPELYRQYLAQPERLRSLVKANSDKTVFVIDEVQLVPQILQEVHAIIESRPDIQFILTGSSARKLKRSNADMLGGRAGIRRMHPFTALELKDQFSIETALSTGLIPVVFNAREPKDALAGYINVYLDQEVKSEAIVRNIDNFVRFLEAISFSQGGILNVANISRECQVHANSIRNYVAILKDLLIAETLPCFHKRMSRELVSHEKFYFFDCGLYRELRPTGPLDRAEEITGVALETLVYQNLQAWIESALLSVKLYFWRTQNGFEVDFVVYGENCFVAIEVKNSGRIRPEDLRGLKSFTKDYPEAKLFFLYRGSEKLDIEGILCLPVSDFLLSLDQYIVVPKI
jgi:predicted AAA+ superfamily ATPase